MYIFIAGWVVEQKAWRLSVQLFLLKCSVYDITTWQAYSFRSNYSSFQREKYFEEHSDKDPGKSPIAFL